MPAAYSIQSRMPASRAAWIHLRNIHFSLSRDATKPGSQHTFCHQRSHDRLAVRGNTPDHRYGNFNKRTAPPDTLRYRSPDLRKPLHLAKKPEHKRYISMTSNFWAKADHFFVPGVGGPRQRALDRHGRAHQSESCRLVLLQALTGDPNTKQNWSLVAFRGGICLRRRFTDL